jgi:hypothetical protein
MLEEEHTRGRAMICCPGCGVNVEPFWEDCGRCDAAAVTTLTRHADPGRLQIGALHQPPPYHGERRSSGPALTTVGVLVAVTMALLALMWLAHPASGASGVLGF